MNKKLLLVLSMTLLLAFMLTACEIHEHTYSSEWSTSPTHHWREATCEHSGEKIDEGEHFFQPVLGDETREQCEICKYIKVKPIVHEHTYSEDWSSNATHHWHQATCAHTQEVTDYEPHEFVNGACVDCGMWGSATEVIFDAFANLDVWKYTLTLNDVNLYGVDGFIGPYENLSVNYCELNVGFDDKKLMQGYGYFSASSYEDVSVDGKTVRAQYDVEFKVVIKDNVLYAVSDGLEEYTGIYFRCDVIDLLRYNGVDVAEIQNVLEEIDGKTNEIYQYYLQIKDLLRQVASDESLSGLINALVKVDENKSVGGDTVYVLDCDAWRKVNDTLATVTLSQYVDGAFGEGTYDRIPALLRSVFKMRVGDLLEALEQRGYTLDDILNAVNSVIAEHYPDPDVNTIEDLLEANGQDLQGVTVKELIVSSRLFTVETLWNMAQTNNVNKISAEQVIETVKQYCAVWKDFTLYDIVAQFDQQFTASLLKLIVDETLNVIESYFTVEFHLSADNTLKAVNFKFALPQKAEQPDYSEGDLSEEQLAAKAFAEQIKRYMSAMDGNVALIKDHVSTQDYSEVINTVNSVVEGVVLPDKDADVEELARSIVDALSFDNVVFSEIKMQNGVLKMVFSETSCIILSNEIEMLMTVRHDADVDFYRYFMALALCKDKLSLEAFIVSDSEITNEEFVFGYYDETAQEYVKTQSMSYESAKQYILDNAERYPDVDLDELKTLYERSHDIRYSATLYYDAATKSFVSQTDCEHDFELVEDQSVITAVCGEYSKIVVRCKTCEKTIVAYRYNEHDFDYNEPVCVMNGSSCEDGAKYYIECSHCQYRQLYYETSFVEHIIDEEIPHTFKLLDPSKGCEGGVNETGVCLTCGNEVTISFTENHDYDYEHPSHKVLKDGCCDGVEVSLVCSVCGKSELIGTVYDHTITEIDIQVPDTCCDDHVLHVFMCKVCDKIVGFQYENMTANEEGLAGVYECKTCGLTIAFEVDSVLKENSYYLSTTKVMLNGQVIWSKQQISYVGSGNSYPADRQPDDL